MPSVPHACALVAAATASRRSRPTDVSSAPATSGRRVQPGQEHPSLQAAADERPARASREASSRADRAKPALVTAREGRRWVDVAARVDVAREALHESDARMAASRRAVWKVFSAAVRNARARGRPHDACDFQHAGALETDQPSSPRLPPGSKRPGAAR